MKPLLLQRRHLSDMKRHHMGKWRHHMAKRQHHRAKWRHHMAQMRHLMPKLPHLQNQTRPGGSPSRPTARTPGTPPPPLPFVVSRAESQIAHYREMARVRRELAAKTDHCPPPHRRGVVASSAHLPPRRGGDADCLLQPSLYPNHKHAAPAPLVYPTLRSHYHCLTTYPPLQSWIPDLTAEGIEPNPGPEHTPNQAEDPQILDSPMALDSPPPLSFQDSASAWQPDPAMRFGPTLQQLPSGKWFERTFLPSPEILGITQDAQQAAIDTLFSGDGLENRHIPSAVQTYHLFNQNQLGVQQLRGKHTLLFFPKPLPFTDSQHVFSFRSWCFLAKDALAIPPGSDVPTKVSIVFPARQNSPTPSVVPILDRRFELDVLRRFLRKILVLPDVPWDERDTTGEVSHSREHRMMPLLLYCFSNAPTHQQVIRPQVLWMPSPDPELRPPPGAFATHVLLNCHTAHALTGPTGHPLSAIRLVMLLNQFDPSESTTQFRAASECLRYPAEPLPQMQKSSPEGVAIAHYHVPPQILFHLEEDRDSLKLGGIEWIALPASQDGLFVVNHVPRRRPDGKQVFKASALEVRDGVLAASSISDLLEFAIILNRWEVLIRPRDGVQVPLLSAALLNLDNYSLLDATTLTRIFPENKLHTCTDPDIFVFYPLHLLSQYVLSVVASISPIHGHQDSGKAGSVLVRFQYPGVAPLLYGLRMNTGTGPISFTCGDSTRDASWEQRAGLPPAAPLAARQGMFPPPPAAAQLNAVNLLALSDDTPAGNGPRGSAASSPR